MIETAVPDNGDMAVAPAPADDGLTAGGMLRGAREAAGLHVAALAVSLKVPVRKLEALESDRYQQLSDAVFVRALASSVCRTLKIDPQPVLDRLPQIAAPRLVQDSDGLNTPFRGPRDGATPTWPDQLSRPVTLAVFGLLLGALVLIFLPRMQKEEVPPSDNKTVEVPSPDAAAVEPAAAPAATASASAAATATSPAATGPGTAQADPVSPASLSVATVAAPAAMPQQADSAPSAQAAAASGLVAFHARQSSWVEVTDAQGAVAFRKLLAAGESGAASGAVPLQVTVGRADVTDFQVRGKPFDLRPVSRDNVARFEVK